MWQVYNRKVLYLVILIGILVQNFNAFIIFMNIYRYDWYQTESDVVVNILAKQVKPENVRIDIVDNKVCISSLVHLGIMSLFCTLRNVAIFIFIYFSS